ncbi:fungal-specific transcription factor domain-containing protein [Coniochaeta sp. 2T2.1]|nr:fungal-specific transcription factor domain-containing protein [Coniochaeta sp. 2T2.1]
MTAHSIPSPTSYPSKRPRQSSPDKDSPTALSAGAAASPGAGDVAADVAGAAGKVVGQSSNFRNVSACNRCRLRKNRCDQKLPSCASCEKAGVACVGYDPITKREIPRSYVYYLETRVDQLETLLKQNNIPFPPSENLEYCSKGSSETKPILSPTDTAHSDPLETAGANASVLQNNGEGDKRLQTLASKTVGAGINNPRHLGSISGVSFARVVFAAVQSSVSDQKSVSDKAGVRPYKPIAGNANSATGTSMRDSFFGLHTKPTIHPATFPDRALGTKLITLYFEHANPQIPVLHKGDFMQMFEAAYAEHNPVRGPKELYTLNMVFAIGGGIIMDYSPRGVKQPPVDANSPGSKQCQPEEYHASAIVHLEACLSNSGGGLAELQAVLLLANFALLRPVPPGLWYIVGVAIRLAVDLGLHYEDGKDVGADLEGSASQTNEIAARERGRREYIRDLRRRLWWCTYSFDRLVSVSVGRPFGCSDQIITTEFPSLLEDRYITPGGFIEPPPDRLEPTYKLVAHHYFRLRLLQSEILQVLQFQQAEIARAGGQNARNPYMHKDLPSPFLARYDSFRSWRIDIDKRLYEWKNSAPTKKETGVAFSTEFLDLNYWQAIVMLYRQSLSVPAMFEGEYNTAKEVDSPTVHNVELREDEDRVYLKVAEAGQKILRLYRQLHIVGVVNYTYLATHHLFMAGISYLYAIWHSPIVRSRLTMDEVDFTILAATSVFTDLIEKCPPAEACRDAFDRTAKATLKMANSTGGFGQVLPQAPQGHKRRTSRDDRLNWSTSNRNSDAASSRSGARSHQHQQRISTDYNYNNSSSQCQSQYDMSAASDTYSNSASSATQLAPHPHQQKPPKRFRPSHNHNDATSESSFSLIRHPPPQPHSTASTSSTTGLSPDAASADISVLLPSPSQGATPPQPPNLSPLNNPSSYFNPSALQQPTNQPLQFPTPSDLQGMDFLRSLNSQTGSNGMDAAECGGGNGGQDNTQMDLNFGLGWEGLHHDFSDGQQLDLFDGFFFGDQRGTGGGNGMGLSMVVDQAGREQMDGVNGEGER